MSKVIIATLITLLLMTGCAAPTQAQRDQNAFIARGKKGVADSNECMVRINSSVAGWVVLNEVLFVDDASKNKFELMTAKNKLNPAQAQALKEYISAAVECRAVRLQALSGSPLYGALSQYFDTLDSIYLQLLQGEMTIGEANIAKDKALKKTRISLQNAGSEMKKAVDSQSQQELEQRQQSAQRLMNYLQSHRTVNTNCTAIGNSIDCVSR